MRRFTRSSAYARVRLAFAALFVVCGVVLLYRTAADTGLRAAAIPAYVLGVALVALGVVRYRDYFAARPR